MFCCRFVMFATQSMRQTVSVLLSNHKSQSQSFRLLLLPFFINILRVNTLNIKQKWLSLFDCAGFDLFSPLISTKVSTFFFFFFFQAVLIWSDCVGYSTVQLDHIVSVRPLRTLLHHPCLLLCVMSLCVMSLSSLIYRLEVRLVIPSRSAQ